MLLFKKSTALSKYLRTTEKEGSSIGFVPTMGALHAGHLALVEAARKSNKITVASIFVNPAQFNDPADFAKYPVTIEKDIEMLEAAGCDVLFWPTVDEIYPPGSAPAPVYPLGYLETILEGRFRPGHFQGVCRVMDRLLSIVQPTNLYMGQKDYQQCMVVQRLMDIIGCKAVLHTCETLREADGLAMSSRNMRLSPSERQRATGISQALLRLKTNLRPGNVDLLVKETVAQLMEEDFKVDYVAVADASTLELIAEWDGHRKLVALVAAFQHEIRLIDNMLLN